MHQVYDSEEPVYRSRYRDLTVLLSLSDNKVSVLKIDFGAQY